MSENSENANLIETFTHAEATDVKNFNTGNAKYLLLHCIKNIVVQPKCAETGGLATRNIFKIISHSMFHYYY